jgi:hypothetical protein
VTALLLFAIARMVIRVQKLSRGKISAWKRLAHAGMIFLLNFAWSVPILTVAITGVPYWNVTAAMQPDLTTWLLSLSVVAFLAGLAELAVLFRRGYAWKGVDRVNPNLVTN